MLIKINNILIYEKITTRWNKKLKIFKIIIINNIILKDKTKIKLLKQVLPLNITSYIININKFIKIYKNIKYLNKKISLLFINSINRIKIVKKNINIKSININNIFFKKNTNNWFYINKIKKI